MDDATKARIVEAGARAIALESGVNFDQLPRESNRDIWRKEARACLSAALALAEQEGVIFTRVPGEKPFSISDGVYATERRVGFNQAITDTLAAKVTL
jgi:hypothetical protein